MRRFAACAGPAAETYALSYTKQHGPAPAALQPGGPTGWICRRCLLWTLPPAKTQGLAKLHIFTSLFSPEDNNTTHFHLRQALTRLGSGWYNSNMEKMHYNISVRLFTAGKCFGPGMAALLSLVRERHSLRAAAAEMGMAYSKAWRILRDCEGALGFPLLDAPPAAATAGGAVLTAEAEALLSDYETFCRRLREEGDSLFSECFERWMNWKSKRAARPAALFFYISPFSQMPVSRKRRLACRRAALCSRQGP